MAGESLLWDRTRRAVEIAAIQNRWIQGAAVAAGLFVVYWFTRGDPNPFNQYTLLADSFLHGRLHLVDAPLHLELARYGDKAYVIDPPAPTLFLMPLVALYGTDINQVTVSLIVGAAGMGLFWIATRQMGWDLRMSVAITLLLALGTNFWWAATDGQLWTFAHVSAVFFLMAALVEATGTKRPWLVGLLVGLAGMSRLPTFLTFPLFAYLITDAEGRAWGAVVKDRKNWFRLTAFGLGLGIMAAAYLAYNYGRYGTLMDKGYDHPSYANEPWFSEGRFDISYIPRHIDAIFFQKPVPTGDEFPFFKPQNVGLALFFTTPAFLYLFNTKINRLTLAAIVASLLTLVPLVLHGTTGWNQFGYRFSMDLFPMLAILTAAGMRGELSPLKWTVISLSCLVSLWGTLAFHQYGWVA